MTRDTTIERIESWAVDLPLAGTLSFGAFTVTARQYAAVRVVTKGGLVADCLGHTRRSPVDVAISDLLAPRLVGTDALDRGRHVAEEKGVVPGWLRREECTRLVRVAEAAPDEHGSGRVADLERPREGVDALPVARSRRPAAVLHGPVDGTEGIGRRSRRARRVRPSDAR